MISVLLIDDDPELLDILSLELADEEDFAIQTSISPAGAIELAQARRFDSIVCDYFMPGMDGCSVLEHLRSRGCTAQRILYTGKGPDEEISRALAGSIDAYVQRAGNPDAEFRELKTLIRDAFKKKEQGPR